MIECQPEKTQPGTFNMKKITLLTISMLCSLPACHGPAGISVSPLWPNLAGQKEAYLVKQIKAFKAGERKDPSMAPMVAGLTDADIDNLAAYYASLK